MNFDSRDGLALVDLLRACGSAVKFASIVQLKLRLVAPKTEFQSGRLAAAFGKRISTTTGGGKSTDHLCG